MRHLRPNFKGNGLLELLGDRVLNEPTVELDLRVFDHRSILVLERQFLSIVLTKDGITFELLFLGDAHGNYLVFVRDVAELKGRSQDLTANELTVVDDV